MMQPDFSAQQLETRPSGLSPMITSIKSAQENVAIKHSVARFYIYHLSAKYSIGGVNIGE